ncbi:UNVERIFIED_CONTAM: hypothetical protein FKN15_055270 [Acipenser sinensis]
MLFGDSHLRSLVDGYVQMPEGDLHFGYSSTPGACAAALRKEVLNKTLPEEQGLVCLIAPGNNLSKNSIQQAGKEFASLIRSAQSRWNKAYRPGQRKMPEQERDERKGKRLKGKRKEKKITPQYPQTDIDVNEYRKSCAVVKQRANEGGCPNLKIVFLRCNNVDSSQTVRGRCETLRRRCISFCDPGRRRVRGGRQQEEEPERRRLEME